MNRYGEEEVRTWYFEYWEKMNTNYKYNRSFQYKAMTKKEHQDYFHQFSIIADAFRSCLPKTRIGGGGFPVRMYSENDFTQMLATWKKEKQKPDFISINCYPYIQEKGVDT